jgi:hypothetical protein
VAALLSCAVASLTVPLSGFSRPMMSRSSVDLPALQPQEIQAAHQLSCNKFMGQGGSVQNHSFICTG